jgi:hypothetical protein
MVLTPMRRQCTGLLVLLGHKTSGGIRSAEHRSILSDMTPGPAAALSASEVYAILRNAATRRQPVAATYEGQPRLLCPHVGGRKSGQWHVFCYQFGGGSNSAESLAPEDGGLWRCFAVEKLSQVELRMGAWHTEPRSNRQTCIDDIDFDTDAQLGDDPHKGQ